MPPAAACGKSSRSKPLSLHRGYRARRAFHIVAIQERKSHWSGIPAVRRPAK